MASQIFKGGLDDLKNGDLDGTPDLRIMLSMGGHSFFSDDPGLVVNVDDITTQDEFDGLGYTELDAAGVVWSFDATADEWRLTFTDGDDVFGDPVAPGAGNIAALLVKRYVDGTDANDIAIGATSDGGFGVNTANGKLGLTLPAEGLLFHRSV